MPSINRRSLLASVGTVAAAGLAGCGLRGNVGPPAGSLQFVNEHAVPHAISMRVVGVGAEPGHGPDEVEGDVLVPPSQRTLTASTTVQPGETQTYESVFTEDAWYGVEFTLDGIRPADNAGQVKFNPAPTGGETGSVLVGKVYASGEFSWVVSATEDPGSFDA